MTDFPEQGITTDKSSEFWSRENIRLDLAEFLGTLAIGVFLGRTSRCGGKWISLFGRAPTSIFNKQPMKMVIVVRSDVSMSPGKIASQCAHAAVGCFFKSFDKHPKELLPWILQGQAKVVLRGGPGGDTALMQLQSQAIKNDLTVSLIKDAGRTEVRSGTNTALGIGPGPVTLIDRVTGHLKTY